MHLTDMLELMGFIFVILNLLCGFLGSIGAFMLSRRNWNYAWILTLLAAFSFAAYFRIREVFEPTGIHPMQMLNTLCLFAWVTSFGLLCRIVSSSLDRRIGRRWLLGIAVLVCTLVTLALLDRMVNLVLIPILPRALHGYYFINTRGFESLNSGGPIYVLALCLLISWGIHRRRARLLIHQQEVPADSGKDHEGAMPSTLVAHSLNRG